MAKGLEKKKEEKKKPAATLKEKRLKKKEKKQKQSSYFVHFLKTRTLELTVQNMLQSTPIKTFRYTKNQLFAFAIVQKT